MGTISSAFSLISQALDADQAALSVVANNVANANTTGYTEETPNFVENASVTIHGISSGAGVTETGATSVRDRVLEERLAQQQQLASASGSRLTALDTLQALFTPASGSSSSTAGNIGSDITSFFSAFSSLEANPTDNALRQQVLSKATLLAGDISGAAASVNSQRSALDQEAAGVASQVNSLTGAIAQLSEQIQSALPDADAGTLEDQRQQDLSQLSQLIGINQVTTENNGLSITTTGGELLASSGSSFQLTTGMVDGVTHFFVGTTDVTAQLNSGGGLLGGCLTARDQDIPSVLASLDTLAYNISTAVNTQNNAGIDLKGDTGVVVPPSTVASSLNLFSAPPNLASGSVAGSAEAMSVAMTDPDKISAASVGQGTGDNSNAKAMANLATGTIVDGETATNYYSNFVTALGATVSGVQTENTAQNASVTQLQTQSDALSGVNLNDEAASLQKFERSYQAAAQVFTILNTIMASALNLGDQTAVS